MKKLASSAAIAAVFLTGCASTKTAAPIAYSDISIPKIGNVNTVTLGERMLMQGTGYWTDSIFVRAADKHAVDIPLDTIFYKKSDGTYQSDAASTIIGNNTFGDPIAYMNTLTYHAQKNEICFDYDLFPTCYEYGEMFFEPSKEKVFRLRPNSFQQVIEYNGKTGTTLKFTYREFSGDSARPAITTDFVSDSADSNLVGYKGALVEVVESTNSTITYKVLKNFN